MNLFWLFLAVALSAQDGSSNRSRTRQQRNRGSTSMATAPGMMSMGAAGVSMGVQGAAAPGVMGMGNYTNTDNSQDSSDSLEAPAAPYTDSAAMPAPTPMPSEPLPDFPQMPAEPEPTPQKAAPAAAEPAVEAPPPASGPSAGGIFAIVSFVVILIGGIFYAISAMEGAIFQAARTAAAELGCPHPPFRTKTFTEDYEVHQWNYNGVSLMVQAGSKIVAVPGAPTGAVPIMGITVIAELPKKLPFQFAVNKPALMQGPFFKTGDSLFDDELGVVTSNDEAARKLLADAGLRHLIRELFQSDRSLPTVRGWLSEKEVTVDSGDRRIVRENCLKAAALAKALTQKSEALSLFSTTASAPQTAALALPACNAGGPTLAQDDIAVLFPSWSVEGSCLYREEGIYVFVKVMNFVSDKPGAGELLGAGFGQAGALVGALGEAAGAALDASLRDSPAKPEGLFFGSSSDISDRLGKAMQEAPGIANCREYFIVPRADIQKVQLDAFGHLAVMTAVRSFTLSGGDMEKAKGFLAFRGYPIVS